MSIEFEDPKPKKAKKEDLAAKAIKWAEEARDAWLAEHNTPEKVQARVFAVLNKRLEDVIGQLLGFDARWGRWEVDHCNGRDRSTAAGDTIRERADVAVNAWLAEKAGGLSSVKLPKAIGESLRKEYEDALASCLKRKVRELAEQRAEAEARATIDNLTGEVKA